MIPKVIHYCWFGRNPLPESARNYIDSWKKFLPDYEIKEWNEDNFDMNIIPYTAEAYQCKKYAFVSDYARFWILYHYGGLYFDTDVEIVTKMDDIVAKGPFMGMETPAKNDVSVPRVNPGLGVGANKGLELYKKLLDYYNGLHFLGENGLPNEVTIVEHTTKLLSEEGMLPKNEVQKVDGVWIYPVDYFNPYNDLTGELKLTKNTRSIHWYSKTWMSKRLVIKNKVTRILHKWLGIDFVHRIGNFFR